MPPALCRPLPTQVYDFIDRHITKLDKDCKAFDAGGCARSSQGRAVKA